MVYGAALIPDKDIYRNNGEQEFYISFTKESIEKMSQEFMKEYRQNEVTLDHEEMANDITITESWLVEDSYKDKANALGINVPEGTWMVGMKVNQIDVWDRVKSGELKGFSVESMISLEEFSKNDNNMNIETNDMGFWSKMKEVLAEAFSKKEEPAEIEPTNIELEEEPQAEPQPTVEAPKVEEPKADEPKVEEPKVEEPKPQEEPKQEEAPKAEEPKDNHLEELINSLKEEIAALKTSNGELQEKIKDMGKQPSANPVNTNAKPSANSTYSAWREQMAKYM
jgi:outer membrane biosynthesis protein TonB